jgi:hypothetical protein
VWRGALHAGSAIYDTAFGDSTITQDSNSGFKVLELSGELECVA